LIDYKTSNSKKWPREAKEDLQLATYLLACVRNDDLKQLGPPKAAELVYVRHEYKGRIDRVQQVPSDNVPEDDSTPWDTAIENRIQTLLKGIGEEEFNPNVKADCMFCKFKTLCPLWAEGEELKVG